MPTGPKTTVSTWKKAAVHPDITLPSGTKVTIKLPDIPKMIESGQIPNELVDLAVTVAQGGRNVPSGTELVGKQIEFTKRLLTVTVIEPKITEEDVTELPVEDRELLVNLATRATDLDAVGNQIGGLHKQAQFRALRGIPDGYEGVEGL